MSDQNKIILFAVLAILILVIFIILIRNSQKKFLKRKIADLTIRFNEINSSQLAFKLNKAQIIARRNAETSASVAEYYEKYEVAQKHIDSIQGLMDGADDAINSRRYSEAKEAVRVIEETIGDSEREVAEINAFLEQFSEKEKAIRDYSSELKEEFQNLKLNIANKSNSLSIAYDGIEKQLNDCGHLFSTSEEWLIANDYHKAQEDLDTISSSIKRISNNVEMIPDSIGDVKGLIPLQLEEVERNHALIRQRGTYIKHLNVEDKINNVKELLKKDQKILIEGNVEEVKEDIDNAKKSLKDITDSFEEITKAFNTCKEVNDNVITNVSELERLENYVRLTYQEDGERFGLEDIQAYLNEEATKIQTYRNTYMTLSDDLLNNTKPTTTILEEAKSLLEKTELDKKELLEYKNKIDKSNADEERAIEQLIKLQVVLNEVESKVAEYHLPRIADAYKDDLVKAREYVTEIKRQLAQVPLETETLNATLDEAIHYIYKFYNNVNNVVGMAIMVEKAIVFGNKYRSTYPEIDRELSKAEFSFLNGEYTRALKMAISSMEMIFPNNADSKILGE